MTVFGNAWGFDSTLLRDLSPSFDAVLAGGFKASREHSDHHFLQESVSKYITKVSL